MLYSLYNKSFSNIKAILVYLIWFICYYYITTFYIYGDSGIKPHKEVAHSITRAIALPQI